jgi:hypothetical protein
MPGCFGQMRAEQKERGICIMHCSSFKTETSNAVLVILPDVFGKLM